MHCQMIDITQFSLRETLSSCYEVKSTTQAVLSLDMQSPSMYAYFLATKIDFMLSHTTFGDWAASMLCHNPLVL